LGDYKMRNSLLKNYAGNRDGNFSIMAALAMTTLIFGVGADIRWGSLPSSV